MNDGEGQVLVVVAQVEIARLPVFLAPPTTVSIAIACCRHLLLVVMG